MLGATTKALAVVAYEMTNAVHGSRAVGVETMAGIQTNIVKALNIPASIAAASRG
jgi:hypothetical protein